MRSLQDLLSAARRARSRREANAETSARPDLAGDVLRALRESAGDSDPNSEFLRMGRWAAGVACALALLAVVAGPRPTSAPAPEVPSPNPLAEFAGW